MLLLPLACGGERGPEEPGPTSGLATVEALCPCPEAYDPDGVEAWDIGHHIAARYPDSSVPRDDLVVILHGAGQRPANHRQLLNTAAYAGFHVVSIHYDSLPGVDTCPDRYPDDIDGCIEGFRRARVYGAEYPEYLEVPDEKSIVALIYSALMTAETEDPEGVWARWLLPSEPSGPLTDHENWIVWSDVIVSGFSQGGGHSALIATDQLLDGVLMISGPADPGTMWIQGGLQTPGCVMMAFRHDDEQGAFQMDFDFEQMGLVGPVLDVEPLEVGACETLTWPPYGGAQWFGTTFEASDRCSALDPLHASMANDACMNTDRAPGGDPYALFRPYLSAYCRLGVVDPEDCAPG